ncbi:unnamed protein product [Macrosiphum euphorbiae]|uniref:Uncharacterized protein n=1 Tax=Macrosiphum euphorbiae TaxID=13131 RepID=A0AAV0X0N4_9HEMI|nr:unnamed protein product [Macrosiphum euphorbiae]
MTPSRYARRPHRWVEARKNVVCDQHDQVGTSFYTSEDSSVAHRRPSPEFHIWMPIYSRSSAAIPLKNLHIHGQLIDTAVTIA